MVQRALLTSMLLTVVACTGATRPTSVVRIAPRATASSSTAPSITVDASLTIAHREPVVLVSSLDHEDRSFAIAADGKTLVGIDTRGGKELWRSDLAIATDERVSIYPDFGAKRRVVVHAGYELVFVDPENGTVVARAADAVRNFKSINDIVSTVEQPYGACVVHTECSMQPIDCDDGRRIGPEIRRTVLRVYRNLGEPHDTMCQGDQQVVGRAAGLVVLSTTEETPVLKGIDARSGAMAWSRALTCHGCSRGPSGVSEDGTTCWVSGHSELEAFTCATGRPAFTRTLTPSEARPEVITTAVRGGGIFVSDSANALLLDPKSGRPLWSKHLDPGTLGLPLATSLDLPAFSTWGAHTVALLDPNDGHEVTRFAQPAYTELRQGADLGLRLEGGPAYDARGVKRWDRPPATFLAKNGALVAADGKVVADGARSISVVATHSSNAVDVVTFEAWSAGRLELLVAQRAR